jgi:5-methylcytosine-specific restriction endonuclease McrA
VKTIRVPEKILKGVLAVLAEAEGARAIDLEERVRRLLPGEKKLAAKAERRASKKTKRQEVISETDRIRLEVWTRSQGLCESCGLPLLRDRGELDHFFGGNGRRIQLQCVANCWRCCGSCHRQKTDNQPTRLWWLRRFLEHLIKVSAHGGWAEQVAMDYQVTIEHVRKLISALSTVE